MLIRKATKSDIKTLLNFGEKLHLVEKEFEPFLEYSRDEINNKYLQQLNNPLALFLIAEDSDNSPMGYLYAHTNKINSKSNLLECQLEVIYILPEFRNKGLSKQLINECINWAKEKQITRIKTEIFSKNTISVKAFENTGFNQYSSIYSLDIV
ncbi:MAG: GNAT family N-acetyltransferase [Candidatus Pacebacteria bacterium]|nr:GNAT family N-acetyltransferase [Candidatus Paceibacterota bacterium]